MTDEPLAPELDPNDQIQFAAHHRVSLEAGNYTLQIQQVIRPGTPAPLTVTKDGATRAAVRRESHFAVRSERLHLQPQDVHAVFPPDKSRGSYWHAFPHVLLERSTMPWERSAVPGERSEVAPPWLALLLFHQADFDAGRVHPAQTKTVAQLAQGAGGIPGFARQGGEQESDAVQTVQVDRGLLTDLLPPRLRYSHHARRRLAFLCPAAGHDLQAVLNAFRAAKLEPPPGLEEPTLLANDAQGKPAKWHALDREEHQEYQVWRTGGEPGFELYRVDGELAAILADRLPQPNARNVAHLVSVENLLVRDGADLALRADAGDPVELVSLHSFTFFCDDPSRTFSWILEGLNTTSVAVRDGRLERPEFPDVTIEQARRERAGGAALEARPEWRLLEGGAVVGRVAPDGDWSAARSIAGGRVLDENGAPLAVRGVLFLRGHETSAELRLPLPAPARADATRTQARATERARTLVGAGGVPLPHTLREGSATRSWYHGPFVPRAPRFASAGAVEREPHELLPAPASDSLLLFDEEHGLFDVSYAAAWELGRMLTLANTKVALDLAHWKRRHAHDLRRARYLADYGYALPVSRPDAVPADVEATAVVQRWFHELERLVHVPFRYLVPSTTLLPPESLRFFSVDRMWVDCLRDGAFSVGGGGFRSGPATVEAPGERGPDMSGVLIRSEVVSGWPGLRIDGYGAGFVDRETSTVLELLRMERLSKNVLLCLFSGEVRVLDVHLRPETLHFGFDLKETPGEAGAVDSLIKHLRDARGKEVAQRIDGAKLPWKQDKEELRVVDFAELARDVEAGLSELPAADRPTAHVPHDSQEGDDGAGLDPAIFALEMVAGTELVRFQRHAGGDVR